MTPSELQVARLAAAGFSNAAIAKRRNTSTRTVANQMAKVLRELQVVSRRALAVLEWLAPQPRPDHEPDWSRLTPRERDVLARASTDTLLKTVAIELGVSASTVSDTLRAARLKLGFESLSEMMSARRMTLRRDRSGNARTGADGDLKSS